MSQQNIMFVGFTFKQAAKDNEFRNLTTLFEEINQKREQQQKTNAGASSPGKSPEKGKITGAQHSSSVTVMKRDHHQETQKPLISTQDRDRAPLIIQASPRVEKENSEVGKVLYMGPYTRGYLNFNRSNSNEGNKESKKLGEIYSSATKNSQPTQPSVVTLSSPMAARKPVVGLSDSRKPDLMQQNMASPNAASNKKKPGFGFLGLKFLSKNNK